MARTKTKIAKRGVTLDPKRAPAFQIGDNYSEHISRMTVQAPWPSGKSFEGPRPVQVDGEIQVVSDSIFGRTCFLVLNWNTDYLGNPDPARAPFQREGHAGSIENFPIEALDALAVLIPKLVEQAKRDGIDTWPIRSGS